MSWLDLKFDRKNAFWVGLFVASCAVEDLVAARKRARATAEVDAEEKELRRRYDLLQAELVRLGKELDGE